MIKNLWIKILELFGKKAKKQTLNNNSEKYIKNYEDLEDINITAMISNKLAKYTYFKSDIGIIEDNKRAIEVNEILKLVWQDKNKIVSRAYGTGGVILYPFLDNGVLDYSVLSQDRLSINKIQRGKIIDATILSDTYESGLNSQIYYLWTDMTIVEKNIQYKLRATLNGSQVPLSSVKKWAAYDEELTITNVDKVLFGYIKSPIDNRKTYNDYGVPITYGCEGTITEIKDILARIFTEYDVKDAFVGVDYSLFTQNANGNIELPKSKLWKKLNTSGEKDFFQVFSPEIRETSYYTRLKELWSQLENQIGLSDGTLGTMPTFTTATQFRKALFDTLQVIQEMRDNIENGLEDFVYACNVLCNYGNITPIGDTTTNYQWSEALTEDTQQLFNNDIIMLDKGLKTKAEVRAKQTNETLEEAQEVIDIIEENNPSISSLLGNNEN